MSTHKEGISILLIKEVEYATRILEALYYESPLSASKLSERCEIPSPFIYRVLKKLEAAEMISIKRGARGGYYMKGDCNKLTLYDVILAFENTFLVIECMKHGYDCSNNKDFSCCMHREFGRIQTILKNEFSEKKLAELFD